MSDSASSAQVLPIVLGVVVSFVVVIVVKKFLQAKAQPSPAAPEKKMTSSEPTTAADVAPFLTRKKQTVPLSEIVELSHDTRLFRFSLPSKDTILGLPVGKHFTVFAPNKVGVVEGEWNGRPDPEANKVEISRKYTPTSSDDDRGHFDLVIKVYNAGVIERFPDGGKLSQYIDSLSVGDEITIQGPFGLIEYAGRGQFLIKRKPRFAKKLGMIAGGTGITPMLQIITAILKDKEDPTTISLLFANQTEADILLRDTLESLAAANPDRLKLWYTLDRPGDDWKYSTGFINEEMLAEHMPAASDETLVLMCGPPPMIDFACKPNLEKLGHAADNQVTF